METNGTDDVLANPRGSVWRRWDPHIHAPGTKLADQYLEPDSWERFLAAIETSSPRIEALGVTDYWCLDSYKRVVSHKQQGRLPDVSCLFPNIELRFATTTSKGAAVNMHLLVSPNDPEHVREARRFLERLTFRYGAETYRCDRDDLVRLGRAHDPAITHDAKALEVGTNQYKITHEALNAEWRDSGWARENIIIGCVGSSTDGAAGLQADSSMSAVRREIERMAPVIFSSSPKQREFWLGKGVEDLQGLVDKWGGRKLCLHGSDAHSSADIGKPALHAPNHCPQPRLDGDAWPHQRHHQRAAGADHPDAGVELPDDLADIVGERPHNVRARETRQRPKRPR
jgi:hypothetical protein